MGEKRDNIKPLRIAMLGHKRIPSREGGIEVVVEELSTRMVELGHDVTCFNRGGHHICGRQYDSQNSNSYKGVKLKYVFTIEAKGLAAVTSSLFAALKAAFGHFDVVHFHAEGPCAMMWIPKLFGKRCIATVHGLDHQRAKWGHFAKWFIMKGEKCAVRYADEIIVLSQNVQQYFKDTYNRDTILIPNGVTKSEARDASLITENWNLVKDSYILFLGRIVPEKGLRYLIEAYKKLNTDKKLVIAGGSSDTDDFVSELKELAGNDERIMFTGFVQGQLLEELYSNAYIYTLPSDLEGMPLSLLEAMSYGNCCLTSDISECTEVIGDEGVTFEQGNVESLTHKFQELCDNPEIVARYKAKTSDYVCNKYNWDIVTGQTIDLYRGILNCEGTYDK